jgi:hypothetical protein
LGFNILNPKTVTNIKTNVLMRSAYLVDIFGKNNINISLVKLSLFKFVCIFVKGHPLKIIHIVEMISGIYTPYCK